MERKKLSDLAVNRHRDAGDALEGERVIAQARKLGRPIVVPGTSTHRINEIILRSNVLCVLDLPFRLVGEQALKLRDD